MNVHPEAHRRLVAAAACQHPAALREGLILAAGARDRFAGQGLHTEAEVFAELAAAMAEGLEMQARLERDLLEGLHGDLHTPTFLGADADTDGEDQDDDPGAGEQGAMTRHRPG